jgi:enamine deaminase RidA (YjgF/YER057c/UK114 family)
MTTDRVNPELLAVPRGFSHAVVGTGTMVFLAGQTSMNRDGNIVGDTVVDQFRQALRNVLIALTAAGGTADQLANITVYITDMDDYKAHAREIGGVWRELVGRHYPAMAGIGVSRLWDAEAMVEIQAVAVLD